MTDAELRERLDEIGTRPLGSVTVETVLQLHDDVRFLLDLLDAKLPALVAVTGESEAGR